MMGLLKIISDGSLNTRTAWCCQPYADAHRLEYPSGQPNLSGDDLRAAQPRARVRLEVATHAIGDAAVAEALAAYADRSPRLDRARPPGQPGGRTPDGALGLRGSVQPAHLLDDRT